VIGVILIVLVAVAEISGVGWYDPKKQDKHAGIQLGTRSPSWTYSASPASHIGGAVWYASALLKRGRGCWRQLG
jgi:hypothetical protein